MLYETNDGGLVFWCPGCDCHHKVHIHPSKNPVTGASWTWNEDRLNPTITPSVLTNGSIKCHLHVVGGMIHYCEDCEHPLKGKTVRMEGI